MISEKTFLKLFLNIIFFILKHLSERHGAASGNIYGLAINPPLTLSLPSLSWHRLPEVQAADTALAQYSTD